MYTKQYERERKRLYIKSGRKEKRAREEEMSTVLAVTSTVAIASQSTSVIIDKCTEFFMHDSTKIRVAFDRNAFLAMMKMYPGRAISVPNRMWIVWYVYALVHINATNTSVVCLLIHLIHPHFATAECRPRSVCCQKATPMFWKLVVERSEDEQMEKIKSHKIYTVALKIHQLITIS